MLFGKPVTLVEITLPELTFSFSYMQEFPIIGPLVGTFEGGLGATIDLRVGYDTQGITDFIASKNPAALFEGFFFDTHDASGNPLPVATLTAEVAVGAAIDLGLIKAGVEGGITATITFSWDDLNNDGKVRLDELKANILANGGDPLAVFDIAGEIDLFLKAYVTIELYITSFTLTFEFPKITLFKFSVDFTRPSFLGNLNNGALNLAIGPSSKNRLQGDLTDTSETIHVKGSGGGNVSVWSSSVRPRRGELARLQRRHLDRGQRRRGRRLHRPERPQRLEHRRDHPRRRRERHDHRPAGFGMYEELRRTRRREGVRAALR